jgi:hypothetical protein
VARDRRRYVASRSPAGMRLSPRRGARSHKRSFSHERPADARLGLLRSSARSRLAERSCRTEPPDGDQ